MFTSSQDTIVAYASDTARAQFYKHTYLHVAMAILSFIAVEGILLKTVPHEYIIQMVSGKLVWLFIIGLFWLGSMLADKFVMSVDKNMQYLGLGLFVVLEALIFLPMITIALAIDANVIMQAAIITLAMFGGLTAVAFLSKSDFSFLRTALIVGGFVGLGAIVAGALFGLSLGLWFSIFMVLLACGSILYNTSQIKNTYLTSQYVGAALQLFSSIMLLFWYVLRILLNSRK